MIEITCIDTKINKNKSHFSHLIIQPLEIGHGITIGNALRRTLLADLYGCAISGIRIDGINNEFATITGVKEETLELLMNLKEILLEQNFINKGPQELIHGILYVKGPIIVTAGMFQLPKEKLKILNPNQYICSILTERSFYLEIDIKTDKGYQLTNYNEFPTYNKQDFQSKNIKDTEKSTILLDSFFNPIKTVNYKIKLIYDSKGNLKESLHFEIVTNGTITPYRALLEASKIILNLIIPILVTSSFKKINSTIRISFQKYIKNTKEQYVKKFKKSLEFFKEKKTD